MGFIAKIGGIRFAALALSGGCLASGAAFAGDSYESAPALTAPDQAHCRALGEGFFAVKGSNACMKISGYVSAGVGFVEPGRVAAPTTGPFAAHGAGFTDNHVGVSVDTRFDTELGPGRLYVQVGHDSWAP
jgi:hypothetical protein